MFFLPTCLFILLHSVGFFRIEENQGGGGVQIMSQGGLYSAGNHFSVTPFKVEDLDLNNHGTKVQQTVYNWKSG